MQYVLCKIKRTLNESKCTAATLCLSILNKHKPYPIFGKALLLVNINFSRKFWLIYLILIWIGPNQIGIFHKMKQFPWYLIEFIEQTLPSRYMLRIQNIADKVVEIYMVEKWENYLKISFLISFWSNVILNDLMWFTIIVPNVKMTIYILI